MGPWTCGPVKYRYPRVLAFSATAHRTSSRRRRRRRRQCHRPSRRNQRSRRRRHPLSSSVGVVGHPCFCLSVRPSPRRRRRRRRRRFDALGESCGLSDALESCSSPLPAAALRRRLSKPICITDAF